MFRVVSNIKITQIPSVAWPNRKTVINMDFCNSYEAVDSWRDLTNDGKLILPKNLYFKDQFGKLKPLHGTNVNVGGFDSSAPLFLRGDKVSIEAGYKYFENTNNKRETTNTNVIFEGYISQVSSQIPMEVKLEDNMFLLKQTPLDTKTFSNTSTLEDILKFIIGKVNSKWGTNFTVNSLTTTTFGNYTIGNESASQAISRLQRKYGFEFYFRGNELRGGAIVYLASDAVTKNFTFQQNIIDDDLQYVRKDDITLTAIARNTIVEETGEVTKDGKAKTKRKRLEVLVTLAANEPLGYTFKQINQGDTVPANEEGERRTLFYPGAKTIQELADLAFKEIVKYYYTGLRGTFTTFGLPFVRLGDNANITDPIMPERNGLYKIRKVEYSGGVQGLRQKITLDFKINT